MRDPDGAAGPHGAPLPSYSLRRSARARHARLLVSGRDGLVVVVPARYDLAQVPALLAARAAWIERAIRRVGAPPAPPEPPGVPAEVALDALAARWRLEERPATARRTRVEEGDGTLLLRRGEDGSDEAALEALRAWLSGRARAALVPWLRSLAAAQSLTVGRISVRAQRTRWASCSARGDVSVNRALLFLPPELVAHVLHHELAHRYELNHSPRFRARLAEMDPDAPANEAALRSAWRLVPRWAD